MIAGWLLDVLRCPACQARLLEEGDHLLCPAGHRFPVAGGVPMLLLDEEGSEVAEQHRHQQELYDRAYGSGDRYSVDLWQRAYVDRLRPSWEAQPDAPFLDIGAGGDAYTVIEAARSGLRAVGCDLAPEAMQRARRLALSEGLGDRCGFVVCIAERLPFAGASFGSAAAIHVLEHVTDDTGALAELARVTRPGAGVFLGAPNSLQRMPWLLRPVYSRHDRRIGHLRQYSAESLTEKARQAGFHPTRLVFSAHWAKVWQLAFHLVLRRLGVRDDRLWWWFERLDARAASRPDGLHLNLFLERTPTPGPQRPAAPPPG